MLEPRRLAGSRQELEHAERSGGRSFRCLLDDRVHTESPGTQPLVDTGAPRTDSAICGITFRWAERDVEA